jgi:cytochrome c-type biogenesis protein CcmE
VTETATRETATRETSTRARRMRARYLVASGVCLLAVVAVIVLGVALSKNVVYFRTVSEAVHHRQQEGEHRFRLAGAVVPGTIHDTDHGVKFDMTDGKATVEVIHDGDPPELFKPGAPVVCEGRWGAGDKVVFDSDRILIKHGSDYEPPSVKTKNAPKPDTGAITG